MYKLISYYRSASSYPASARIVQVSSGVYILYICHDHVGTVKYMKGTLQEVEKALFFFTPLGYGFRPILWKKVEANGN